MRARLAEFGTGREEAAMARKWRQYPSFGALIGVVCWLAAPAGAASGASPTSAVSPSLVTTCSGQLIGNPGFETGTAAPWNAPVGVVSNSPSEPPNTGSWDAWLGRYVSTTETLSQTITIPAGCHATLTFWLHIDTAETTTTIAYDTLSLKTGSTTLARWSNLDAKPGYSKKTLTFSGLGTLSLTFAVSEDATLPTCFVIDDVQLVLS